MSKRKVAAVKLFDNRNPRVHSKCGRQERWCSCFLELTNQTPKLIEHGLRDQKKENLLTENVQIEPNIFSKVIDNESNSSKENDIITMNEEIFSEIRPRTDEVIEVEGLQVKDEEILITDSLGETSNSETNNCVLDFNITSVEETSNSSWNDLSEPYLKSSNCESISNNRKVNECKTVRNTFPTVFNKKESPYRMNMCSDKDDIIIPIRYVKRFNEIGSRTDKHSITGVNETSADYDLDTDKFNTSLVEYPMKSSNSTNSKASILKTTSSDRIKTRIKLKNPKIQINNSNRFLLYAYISDIKGIEESLILNKDRRFTCILDRYNCKASIVQLKNLSRGFPHTLLKIECDSKVNLALMARDTDRIHLSWNLRSQLRSVHVN